MNINIKSFALGALLAGVLFVSPPQADAQLTTTSTTLSTTVTANSNAQWCIASATGVVLPSLSGATNGSYLVIDKEAAQVMSQGSSSTCYNVKRGQLGTSASTAHLAGGTIWVGGAAASSGDTSRPFTGAIVSFPPSGYCVAAQQYTLPVILVTTSNNPFVGQQWSCIDQQWTNVTPMSQLTITGTSQVPAAAGTAAAATLTVTGGAGAATTTTTGTGGAGSANSIVGGVGGVGGSSSGAAGAGGASTYTSGAGGAGPVTGGVGGAMTVRAGAGGNGSGAGGSGGALVLGSGAPGTGGTGTAGAVSLAAGSTVLYNTAVGGTGGIASAYFCGATSGTTTCPNTATAGTARVIGGIATLSSNSAVISAISPAFTSTSTFSCVGNDITTRANPVQVVQTSSSSITITNTTGASDVVNWLCTGY